MAAIVHYKENKEKGRQKKYFDRKTKDRELRVQDKVLLLLPTSTNKLLAEWKGPYEVIDQVSPVDYAIKLKKKTSKTFHINMMKIGMRDRNIRNVIKRLMMKYWMKPISAKFRVYVL